MPRSLMLRRSMRCFVLGWWSLVPIIGLVSALMAFADFRAVTLGNDGRWNAARGRLLAGVLLAGLGLLLSIATGTIMALIILKALSEA